MNSKQCRAARAFKNWTQIQLSEKAGVSTSSIARYEADGTVRVKAIIQVVRQTFEKEGIIFLGDHGIDSVDHML